MAKNNQRTGLADHIKNLAREVRSLRNDTNQRILPKGYAWGIEGEDGLVIKKPNGDILRLEEQIGA